MADIRHFPTQVLASILRPLIVNKFSLEAIKAARIGLGITNPLRELERVYRAVKSQIGKELELRRARADRVIDPSLFASPVGTLSKKFLYVVELTVRDSESGELETRHVSILNSRRLTKQTAIRQAIERISAVRPGDASRVVDPDTVEDADVVGALDRDL